MNQRKALVDPDHRLSIRRQADLLAVSRSSFYYKPVEESLQNLHLMELMDQLFTEDATPGVLGMQDELADRGIHYNIKRIRRLLSKIGIEPIYSKKNLLRLGKAKYIHPYVLRGKLFASTDISHKP
ncbi:MAG: IS3 family transposase [Gracilimonas sp.]|nr:IS3 family transposase [Gracilimonas sp.]